MKYLLRSFKKIFVSLVVLGLIVLSGCKQPEVLAEYTGGRYKGTMVIDATKDSSVECKTSFRRYFKKLSRTNRVGHFETTVAVNPEKFKTSSKDTVLNSSVGIAFNVMQKIYTATSEDGDIFTVDGKPVTDSEGNEILLKTGNGVYDFVLISFNAANQFCIKHYEDVPEAVLEPGMDSDNEEFGHYYSFGKYSGTPLVLNYTDRDNPNSGSDWFEIPDAVTKNSDGWNQFTVKVEQTNTATSNDKHTFNIFIGNTHVADYTVISNKETAKYIHLVYEYTEDEADSEEGEDEVSYCITGAFYIFGNAHAGTRVEALFQSKSPSEDEENALFVVED